MPALVLICVRGTNEKDREMRSYMLAAVAVAVIASPAMARPGVGYVGIEGGILFPRASNYNTTTSSVTTATTRTTYARFDRNGMFGPPGAPIVTTQMFTGSNSYGSGFNANYKRGIDVDAIAGYDFGMFRLEGELGYKRTRYKNFTPSSAVLATINNPAVPGYTITTYTGTSPQFSFRDRTTVLSGMVNGLVSFGIDPSVRAYLGGGIGRARVKSFGERQNAWAYQFIGGLSTAISPNVDLGLKYRYFQTKRLHFSQNNVGPFVSASTTSTTSLFPTPIRTTFSTDYTSVYDFRETGKFRSHSLIASLIFNFGGVEGAPSPPAPALPPLPPATQSCVDGSVILATAICPLPPAPPPPSPAPPSKGERG